jgi:uncharacterized membrane protein
MSVLHSPPCAKDTRAIARKNLEGQWPLAVLVTFLAGLLGGQHGFSGGNVSIDLPHAEIPLENIGDPQMWEKLLEELTTKWPAIVFAMVTSLAISAVFFIIGPCIHWGLCRFRLALVDGEQPTVGMLFQGFKSVFLKALGVQVLQSLIILACVLPFMLAGGITAGILILQLPRIHAHYLALTVCVLLGIVGGVLAVIVQYRYAMSYYALVDNPELRATDALRESARMMKGNKWSAFCLDLSFIGWVLLSLFTCGIGALVLAPYTGQAQAVFYHHVSGRAAIREAVEELSVISEGL